MEIIQTLRYATRWGVLGSLVFTVLVVLFFKTGLVYTARNSDGKLKEKIPLSGYAAMSVVVFGVIGIQIVGYLNMATPVTGFMDIFSINYALYWFLLAYDTFIIDILVLCIWRPRFLSVPEGEGFTSIRHHLWTLLPGSLIGLVLTLISTGIIAVFL